MTTLLLWVVILACGMFVNYVLQRPDRRGRRTDGTFFYWIILFLLPPVLGGLFCAWFSLNKNICRWPYHLEGPVRRRDIVVAVAGFTSLYSLSAAWVSCCLALALYFVRSERWAYCLFVAATLGLLAAASHFLFRRGDFLG